MSIKLKLNIVNKYEYQHNEDYRELIITIPNETEKLEKAFTYLGLDNNNLSVQDTHITKCEFIDTESNDFSKEFSQIINNIICKANELGDTTPFQYMETMLDNIKELSEEEKKKILAVYYMKKEEIDNIKEVLNYLCDIDRFSLYPCINSYEEYAKLLIDEENVCIRDIMEFIDLQKVGKAYVDDSDGMFTNHGLVFDCEIRTCGDRDYYKHRNEEEEEL